MTEQTQAIAAANKSAAHMAGRRADHLLVLAMSPASISKDRYACSGSDSRKISIARHILGCGNQVLLRNEQRARRHVPVKPSVVAPFL